MTDIVKFPAATLDHKTPDDAAIANEMITMANRLDEIAENSNMKYWIKSAAADLRETARSYVSVKRIR